MSMTKVTSGIIDTVDASKITGTMPAIDGSALTNLPAGGITEADHWYLTADFQGNATPIASNLARRGSHWAPLGTGMTQTNGLFSFPSTGSWLVQCNSWITSMVHSQGNGIYIRTTQDGTNMSWNNMARSGIYKHSGNYPSETSIFAHLMFNVVDVATHKVDFAFGAGQGSEICKGNNSYDYTYFTFIKLA
jgi:hypothetical protein